MNGEMDSYSLDELGHRGDSVFNRNTWVCAVEIVEVDVVDSQPRQRLVASLMDVLWVAFPHPGPHGFCMAEAELCSKEDLVTLSGLLEPTQPKREL